MRRNLHLLFFVIAVLSIGLENNAFPKEIYGTCGYGLFPPQLKDGVFPHHYQPDRTVDFEHLNLEIKVHMDEMRIEGVAHYTLQPIHDHVQLVRFDAIELEIMNVYCPESQSIDWRYSDNALYVEFENPLPTGKKQTISIQYASDKLKAGGRFQDGMHFTDSSHVAPRSADQLFTIGEPFGASSWFPCGDYPNDRMITEMNVTVPKEFATLSNGLLIDSKEDGEWRTDHWKQKIPHVTYLISLVVGRFSVVRDEWRGIPVEYYVEKGLEEDARPSMGKTPEMIEFFSNFLDYPYPYEKYAQVAVRYFTAGGMEHTTATTLKEWTILDENARRDSDQEGLIMHELAHQWFGDLVTCESWDELWLNEGFATLSDALWDEYSRGEDAYLEAILGKMESYIHSSRSYTRAIVTNLFEDAGEMFDSHSYPKGACVLHMLRQQLGDDLFRKSLNLYLKTNAPGLVDTDDLMESIEKTTGRSMDQFFEQWIFRAGHPKLKVKHEWLADQKQVKLLLKQIQEMKKGEPAFAFPLNIEIRTDDETIEKMVRISQKEESVFIDCSHAPSSVNIDPKINVLMELDHNKSEDMLLFDLEEGSTIIVKIRAIRALANKRSEKIRSALLQTARSGANLRVRQEALSVLGKDRSPEGLNALLSLIDNEDPKIRRKVVGSLGGFYKEKKAIDALINLCMHDSNNNVRADAVEMLAKLKAGETYPILKKNLMEKSWQNRLVISTINTLTELNEKRVYPDLVRLSKDPNHRDVRTTAIRCMGRLAEKHKRLQQEALEQLLEFLKSPADSIRRAAISGLQSLGNEDAIPQLRWIEQNDPKESIQQAAQRAIAEIRRDNQSELAGKNAGRIDQLEERNKQLEDQLKTLEEKINAISDINNHDASSPDQDLDS